METSCIRFICFVREFVINYSYNFGANILKPNKYGINYEEAKGGAMKTVEGTTYYMVPKKLPIINKDGSEGTIELLPNGVNAIAFKFSKKYDPLILRKKDHTPLRVGAAALGTGMGNAPIMEGIIFRWLQFSGPWGSY
ncbi:hypothetical protein [Spiroplasma poulsonii]|uniref:hypothetical protein n=1 Tax=Spiroplasma poulsonii TaxID=2138 RepID=UPI001F4D33EE|nr:hypothetical protein [Spiroplasma poulsonii]UNF62169.1 hypothetical protein MNU24_01510 [Spiroplasma poulsonii]